MENLEKGRSFVRLLQYLGISCCFFLAAPLEAFSVTLEFMGDFNLPHTARLKDTGLNGLSGLTYCPGENRFYFISDDRSIRDPARFYSGQITYDAKLSIEIDRVVFFKNPKNHFFEKNSIDFEGIAILKNGNLLISSEGVKKTDNPPSITEFTKDGHFVRSWKVPEPFFWDSEKKTGVRKNLGLESLAISPDKQVIFTANEQALKQDGEKTTPDSGSPVRLVEYDSRGKVTAQYAYMVEPLPVGADQGVTKGDNGLVDMLVLDRTTLLTLERSYIPELDKVFVKVFQVNLGAGSDVSKVTSLKHIPATISFVKKTSVLDLETIIPQLTEGFRSIDNIEGISFGPPRPDGTPTVFMVSDGNFNPKQRTQFLAFSLQREK